MDEKKSILASKTVLGQSSASPGFPAPVINPFVSSWGKQGSEILNKIEAEKEENEADSTGDEGSRLGAAGLGTSYILTTSDKESLYQYVVSRLGAGTSSLGQFIRDTVASHLNALADRISALEKAPRSSGLTQSQLAEWERLKEAYEKTLVERNDFANRLTSLEAERQKDRSELIKIMSASQEVMKTHYDAAAYSDLSGKITLAKEELLDLNAKLEDARKNAPPPPPSTPTVAAVQTTSASIPLTARRNTGRALF